MTLSADINNNNFTISTKPLNALTKNISFLYGYCFTDNSFIKNRDLTFEEYNYITEHRNEISGIFVVIHIINNQISFIIDPLVQYNVYYYFDNTNLTISNNIFNIAKIHNLHNENLQYFKNYIVKQTGLAGNTLIEKVSIMQYDDIYHHDFSKKFKMVIPHNFENFTILKMDNNIYNDLDYSELKELYLKKLLLRSEIIKNNFDEINISLTGGLDSRLITSLFMNHENVYYYCFGDGKSQDRLVSDYIINQFNLKSKQNVYVVGNKVKTVGDILQCIQDTNCQKMSLDLYINGKINDKICNLTGYYGTNISGGIPVKICQYYTKEFFSFEHNYVDNFNSYYSINNRNAIINDLFYLNNRGLSHYSCDSIANNKYANCFDLLIDPINLKLIEKCPYNDNYINSGVVSIDIIYMIDKKLALLPYDNRIIPKYRDFEYIPESNCFQKHIFEETPEKINYNYIRPIVKKRNFNLLKDKLGCYINYIINDNELQYIYTKYGFLLDEYNTNYCKKIFNFFVFSVYYLHNLNNFY